MIIWCSTWFRGLSMRLAQPAARERLLVWTMFLSVGAHGAVFAAEPVATSQGGESAALEDARPAPVALPQPPSRPAASRAEVTTLIARLAPRHGLDLDLVLALIRAESAFNPHAVSPVGAVGLMQVMPATAADYGVHSVDALFDPQTNLNTGMRHLRRLLDKYGAVGHAVMAYNAGEGALERSGGFVTYAETQRYTHDVIVAYLRTKGIEPYTDQARRVVGIDVTPAMAQAAGRGGDGTALQVADVVEPQVRAPVTRLTSRLLPRLSKSPDDAGPGLRSFRTTGTSSTSILDSRQRLTVDAR